MFYSEVPKTKISGMNEQMNKIIQEYEKQRTKENSNIQKNSG